MPSHTVRDLLGAECTPSEPASYRPMHPLSPRISEIDDDMLSINGKSAERLDHSFDVYISGDERVGRHSRWLPTTFVEIYLTHWKHAPWFSHHASYLHGQGLSALCRAAVFVPQCRLMQIWHVVLAVACLWTVMVVPVEAATTAPITQPFFFIDVIVSLFFMADMLVNCNLARKSQTSSAFQEIGSLGGTFNVWTRSDIVWLYVRSPEFYFDVVCAVPFEFFGGMRERLEPYSKARLLRLARLLRSLKSSKLGAVTRLNLSSTKVTIGTSCVYLLMMSHWLACIWLASSSLHSHTFGWFDALLDSKPGLSADLVPTDLSEGVGLSRVYLWSWYFSVTLVTTVGFGDVVPQNDLECIICIAGLIVGAGLWTHLTSHMFAMYTNSDPHSRAFLAMLDDLNSMMQVHNVPAPLRSELRNYFQSCQALWKHSRWHNDITARLPPRLRSRLALAVSREWIREVPWIVSLFEREKAFTEMFKNGHDLVPQSTVFVANMVGCLEAFVFSPGDRLPATSMHIVQNGLVAYGKAIHSRGSVVGQDLLILNPQNRSRHSPAAITRVGALALSNSDLIRILKQFPLQAREVYYWTRWQAVKNGLRRCLLEQAEQRGLNPVTKKHRNFVEVVLQRVTHQDQREKTITDDDDLGEWLLVQEVGAQTYSFRTRPPHISDIMNALDHLDSKLACRLDVLDGRINNLETELKSRPKTRSLESLDSPDTPPRTRSERRFATALGHARSSVFFSGRVSSESMEQPKTPSCGTTDYEL